VRVGNDAYTQVQLDVYGEVMDALHQARVHRLPFEDETWELQLRLLARLEEIWREPDSGLWEMRGGPRQYVHSKMMCWVAFDRGISTVEEFGVDGPADRWRKIRDEIFDDVCTQGFDDRRNAFTQHYGGGSIDASLLLIPLVGFLPIDDERVQGTIAAVERDLVRDGFVMRYPADGSDGLPGQEGAFLMCTLWLADCYALAGRVDDARALVEQVINVANDVGLLSEEYDAQGGRLLGNFPQAYSHVGVATALLTLSTDEGPSERRSDRRR
jgi:GH15 family glucan-1,4-alpha-glucosidase